MLDAGGGAGSAMEAIGKSFADFATGAAAGAFAVNESGGKALLAAIRNMRDWVDGNRGDLQEHGTKLPLGGSQGAHVMVPYMQEVATDNQGFVPMLLKFRESLEVAEQGINDAMRNYQDMDQRGVGRQQTA